MARGTPLFIAVPPILLGALAAAVALEVMALTVLIGLVLTILAVFTVFGLVFFRDPVRTTAEGLGAPVHGRVLGVDDEGKKVRISTFMGPFDVHVVRAPMDGRLVGLERGGAGFARADTPSASHNVRVDLAFEGPEVAFDVVMLSGWFARRIVPYVSVGDEVRRGARIGLIRFGSRVDVLVPRGAFDVKVAPGTKVRAGSTSLGVMTDAND